MLLLEDSPCTLVRFSWSRHKRRCRNAAEGVAFVVTHHFGVPHPYAADYLQQWGTNTTRLMAQLQGVRWAAALIIKKLEGEGDPSDRTQRHLSRRISGSR
jgi:hypothetical protein